MKKLHHCQDITVFLWSKVSWDTGLWGLLCIFYGSLALMSCQKCLRISQQIEIPGSQESNLFHWGLKPGQYPVCKAGLLLNFKKHLLGEITWCFQSHLLWYLLSSVRVIPLLKSFVVTSFRFPFWKWMKRRNDGRFMVAFASSSSCPQ